MIFEKTGTDSAEVEVESERRRVVNLSKRCIRAIAEFRMEFLMCLTSAGLAMVSESYLTDYK
jgi:hypothetical protein